LGQCETFTASQLVQSLVGRHDTNGVNVRWLNQVAPQIDQFSRPFHLGGVNALLLLGSRIRIVMDLPWDLAGRSQKL